jgi:hypothetical protein
LRNVLEGKPSLELKSRVEKLLEKLESLPPADQLRLLRAVEVLEYIGTAEARQLLESLGQGAVDPECPGRPAAAGAAGDETVGGGSPKHGLNVAIRAARHACHGVASPSAAQFSTVNPGMLDRSLSLLTTVQFPRVSAVAAIQMSFWPTGRPIFFNSKARRPYANAVSVFTSQSFHTSSACRNRRRFCSRRGLPSARNASSASTAAAMPMRLPLAISAAARSKTPRLRSR